LAKKRNRVKIPEKRSLRDISKENQKFRNEIAGIRQREHNNFQTLFLLAIRLREISPEDDIFEMKAFQPQFLELVDKEVDRRKKLRENKEKAPPAEQPAAAEEK